MKKILVTGFTPFGGETVNPALEAIKRLPQEILGVEIITLEIPTVFRESSEVLFKGIDVIQPDAILSIGQAGGRQGITMERVAINIDDAPLPDNEGAQPIDEKIREDGASAYFASLPIKRIVQAVQEIGIPAQISNTAGTYVCNHVMYEVLYYLEKKGLSSKAGFMHIPFLPEQVVTKPQFASMAIETIVKAIEVTLATIIKFNKENDAKLMGGTEH